MPNPLRFKGPACKECTCDRWVQLPGTGLVECEECHYPDLKDESYTRIQA